MQRTISLCAVALAFMLAACHSNTRAKDPITSSTPKKVAPPDKPGVQPPPPVVKQAQAPSGKIVDSKSGLKSISGVKFVIADKAKVNQLIGSSIFLTAVDGKPLKPEDASAVVKKNPSLSMCHFLGGSASEFAAANAESELTVVNATDKAPTSKERDLMMSLKYGKTSITMMCTRSSSPSDNFTWEDVEASLNGIFTIQGT